MDGKDKAKNQSDSGGKEAVKDLASTSSYNANDDESYLSIDQETGYLPPRYVSSCYDPLPMQYGAIRILVLHPGSSDSTDIHCELVNSYEYSHGAIGQNEPYEALSWCWGTEGEKSHITIRKGLSKYTKYVSRNLYLALRALRHHLKARYLWVDAVCINQDSLEEKSRQVSMMDEIYSNATHVCVWLGEATESSRMAIQFIEKEVLQEDLDNLCEGPQAAQKWIALFELLQRPWFTRRWVVQEIAFARKGTIYCGKDMVSWDKFAMAIGLFVEVETATHRLSDTMKRDPTYNHVPGWFDNVGEMGASLLAAATSRFFRDYHEHSETDFALLSESESDSESYSDSGQTPREKRLWIPRNLRDPQMSLQYLVSTLTSFNTTVPHDNIYALISLAGDVSPVSFRSGGVQPSSINRGIVLLSRRKRYRVDYGLPYVDACKVFIEYCINGTNSYDPSRALDVLCRPWATEEKFLESQRRRRTKEEQKRGKEHLKPKSDTDGEAYGGTQTRENVGGKPAKLSLDQELQDMPLPSWIPQLSGAPFAMLPQPGVSGLKLTRKNADPLVGLPGAANYAAAETKTVDMKTLKFRKRADLSQYSMYVKGFVLDEIAEVGGVSNDGRITQEWAELGGWPEPRRNPPDEFWRTLVANREKDGLNPPEYWSTACKEAFQKGGYASGFVNTTDLVRYERNPVLSRFCRRVQSVIWNRALVRTERGRLGLVGKGVMRGDLVCILYGCSVPVILRRGPERSREEIDAEMEWDLKYFASRISDIYKEHHRWLKELRERKRSQMKLWTHWERDLCRAWLQDVEWRYLWRNKHPWPFGLKSVAGLERTQRAFEDHLRSQIFDASGEMSREFDAWKKERGELAKGGRRHELRPRVINWQEFDLMIKYARFWKAKVAQRKYLIWQEIKDKVAEVVGQGNLLTSPLEMNYFESSRHYLRQQGLNSSDHPTRMRLSETEKEEYDRQIRENYRQKGPFVDYYYLFFGGSQDSPFPARPGEFYFSFLGECYIHGMMDGEALAYQNREGTPPTVFDLR